MNKDLLQRLIKHSQKPTIPFHMPGHKRNILLDSRFPWQLDITEISGFDSLHKPEGIIWEIMKNASTLWKSKKAFLSVNGSTGAILAAIRSCSRFGDRILVARNCHKSIFHAIELCGLFPVLVEPEYNADFQICMGVSAGKIKQKLVETPDIKLCVITSPTYEGEFSDISAISKILKESGITLIVDEAHGAHLAFCGKQKQSAIIGGADIVVQSLHKTLPALTQTALLHICSDTIDIDRVQHNLSIFQTSSPSYILMASIDYCINFLNNEQRLFGDFQNNLNDFYSALKGLHNLRVMIGEERDDWKILINMARANKSVDALEGWLRAEKNIWLEYSCGENLLAMATVCDTKASLEMLSTALLEYDSFCSPIEQPRCSDVFCQIDTEQTMSISQAMETKKNFLEIEECAEKICAEYVWIFPPGIPLLIPGQKISAEIVEKLVELKNDGAKLNKTYADDRLAVI